VGRRSARRRSPAGIRRARLPRRAAGAPRSGRARAARGHAGDGDLGGRARSHRAALAAPAPEALASLRDRLAAAERPFVIAGGSGWTAARALRSSDFAERWQLPVGCAFRFQDVFDNRHPNYAGDVGIGINPKLAARVRDADLIVAIGPASAR
jgi:thiamine pyrophosphate-dependent acetolactate synthase large subunit-like protein